MSSIQVAKDIGVHANTIYKWVQQYKDNPDDAFPGKGHLKPEDEELRKLRRRNADLEEENAILKKAMAIFTKHPR
jgi:transposase